MSNRVWRRRRAKERQRRNSARLVAYRDSIHRWWADYWKRQRSALLEMGNQIGTLGACAVMIDEAANLSVVRPPSEPRGSDYVSIWLCGPNR